MRRPVQVRAKGHAFIAHLAQIGQAENLEAARVGKNGAIPRHEPVQPAHLANRFDPRPQKKMVSIAQQNLDAKFFKHILRDALDRTERPNRHKHGRLDLSMRSDEPTGASRAASSFNLQANRHCGGFYKDCGGQRSDCRSGSRMTHMTVIMIKSFNSPPPLFSVVQISTPQPTLSILVQNKAPIILITPALNYCTVCQVPKDPSCRQRV